MSFPAAIDLRRIRPARSRAQKPQGRSISRPAGWKIALAVLLALLVAVAAWFLVRNSSLVAVEQVRVIGLSGYYDKDAKAAVIAEAEQMTTMNFDDARIAAAAGEFVDVAGVKVETNFPHAATIRVNVRRPVLIAKIGPRTVTLSQTGEVMTATTAIAGLPKIETPGVITGDRVTSGRAYEAVRVLGAAPDILLRKVDSVKWGRLGIVVSLENGPALYFGDADNAARKWDDAATVLASSKSRGAAYLDLRVPGRVALGGLGGAPLPESASAASADQAVAPAESQTVAPAAGTEAPVQQATPPAAPVQTAPQTSTPPAASPAGGAAPVG